MIHIRRLISNARHAGRTDRVHLDDLGFGMNSGGIQAEQHPIARRHDVEVGVRADFVIAGGCLGKRERKKAQVGVHRVSDRGHFDRGESLEAGSAGDIEFGGYAKFLRCRVEDWTSRERAVSVEQLRWRE